MSLVPKKQKQNKTEDFKAYHAAYREANIDHIRNLERLGYYKRRYGLDQEFIDIYGEFSGDVFKILKAFRDVITKCPSLRLELLKDITIIKESKDEAPDTEDK